MELKKKEMAIGHPYLIMPIRGDIFFILIKPQKYKDNLKIFIDYYSY